MRHLRLAVAISVALLAALAVACGGGDDDTKASASPTAATTESPDDEGTTVEVAVKEFSFTPSTFTVRKGVPVTVKVTDVGLSLHTLSVFRDEEFTDPVTGADVAVSPEMAGEFTATFDEAGDLYFRCNIHPSQMQGEITVE